MAGTKTNVQKSPSIQTGAGMYPEYKSPYDSDMSYMKMYTAANPSAMALPSATQDFMDALIQNQLQAKSQYLPRAAQLRLEEEARAAEEEMRMAAEYEQQKQIEDMEQAQYAQNLTNLGVKGMQLLKDTGVGEGIMREIPRAIGAIPSTVSAVSDMARGAFGMKSEPLMQPSQMMEAEPSPSAPTGGSTEEAAAATAMRSGEAITGESVSPDMFIQGIEQQITPETAANEALAAKGAYLKSEEDLKEVEKWAAIANRAAKKGDEDAYEGAKAVHDSYLKKYETNTALFDTRTKNTEIYGNEIGSGDYMNYMDAAGMNPYYVDASGNMQVKPGAGAGLAPELEVGKELFEQGKQQDSPNWGSSLSKGAGLISNLDSIIRGGKKDPLSIAQAVISGADLGVNLLQNTGLGGDWSGTSGVIGGLGTLVNLPGAIERIGQGDLRDVPNLASAAYNVGSNVYNTFSGLSNLGNIATEPVGAGVSAAASSLSSAPSSALSTIGGYLPAVGAAVGIGTGIYELGKANTPEQRHLAFSNAANSVASAVAPYYAIGNLAGQVFDAISQKMPTELNTAMQVLFPDPVGLISGRYKNSVHGKVVSKLVNAIGTWICSATKKHSVMHDEELDVMKELADYMHINHKGWMMAYMIHGNKLIKAIEKQEENLKEFYDNIREVLVKPVINVFKDNPEQAFQIYFLIVKLLCAKYMPDFEMKEEANGNR